MIWKIIAEFPNYKISNTGLVKSIRRNIILKPMYDQYGYTCVNLRNKNIRKMYKIHRLVAKYFIDNNFNYSCVNHKNGIKDDNHVNNLEWVNHTMNMNHAYKLGLYKNKRSKT